MSEAGEGQQHVGDLRQAIGSVTAELRNIRGELEQAREDRKLFAAHMQEMQRIKVLAEQHEENQGKFHRGANQAASHEKTLADHETMLSEIRNTVVVDHRPEDDVPAGIAGLLRRHGFKIMMVGLMLYASGSITFNVDWDKVNALLAASAKTPAAAATPK